MATTSFRTKLVQSQQTTYVGVDSVWGKIIIKINKKNDGLSLVWTLFLQMSSQMPIQAWNEWIWFHLSESQPRRGYIEKTAEK